MEKQVQVRALNAISVFQRSLCSVGSGEFWGSVEGV